MEQPQTNVYLSLQRLVWSTFVGVLSFQVIAPNVWGYINKILGIPFYAGYNLFVIMYAVALPILFGTWLRYNHLDLRACLFPIEDEKATNKLCTNFLRGLSGAAIAHFLTVIIFLLWYEINEYLFISFQLVLAGLSVTLLVVGARITRQRIQVFANDLADKAVWKLKHRTYRMLIIWAIFAGALILFGISYWMHNHEKNYAAHERPKIDHGFSMLAKRDSLNLLLQDISRYHDTVRYINNHAALARVETTYVAAAIRNLLILDTVRNRSLDSTHAYIPVSVKAKRLDSLYQHLADLLVVRKELTLTEAQKGLGVLLRDSQLKMTYLLLNFFLILISLYIFLRVDFLIKEYEFERAQRTSQLQPDSLPLKQTFLEKGDKLNDSTKLASNVWLYLTIAIWLLVPLFKPVEDNKIDTEAPFKMLTISRTTDRLIGNTSNDENLRVSNSFNNNIDSVVFALQKTYRGDTAVVSQADLKALKDSLENLNRATRQLVLDSRKLIGESGEIKKRVRVLVPRPDTIN